MNPQLVEFFNNIDFKYLNLVISHLLKTDIDIQFKLNKIERSESRLYFKGVSENIIERCGVFQAGIKECRVSVFSNAIHFNLDNEKPRLWMTLSLSYKHHNGGSNSIEIATCYYSEEKGWEIKFTKDN